MAVVVVADPSAATAVSRYCFCWRGSRCYAPAANPRRANMEYLASDTRYQSMKYNRVGRSGLKIPAVSLGFWHNFGDVDVFQNGRDIARRAFDLGISHFDLANNYGPS